MITFKQYLVEKAMNKGVYADTLKRLGDDALIGLEIEVYVPKTSELYDEPIEKAVEVISLKKFETRADFISAFHGPKSWEAELDSDFNDWADEQEDEWVDENWEEYLDDDEAEAYGARSAETSARKTAELMFSRRKQGMFSKFVFNHLKGPYNLAIKYNLQPQNGWAYKNGNDSTLNANEAGEISHTEIWKFTAKNVAAQLTRALKKPVKVAANENSGTNRAYTDWKLAMDTSILDNEGNGYDISDFTGVGIEIISPPTPAAEALEDLKSVFAALSAAGAQTNDSTSVHINISLPNLKDKLDPLKLVLFMGDEYVLKMFGRLTNTYTVSQYKAIVDGIEATGKLPQSASELEDVARKALRQNKYSSVNLLNLEKYGYLEFRAAGGTGYHEQYERIVDVAGRWLTVLEKSVSPTADRKEYLKKLSLLLGKTGTAKTSDTLKDSDFAELARKFIDNDAWKKANSGKPEAALLAILALVRLMGAGLKDPPSFKQIKGAREFFRENGIPFEEILANARSKTERSDIVRFGSLFKLTGKESKL